MPHNEALSLSLYLRWSRLPGDDPNDPSKRPHVSKTKRAGREMGGPSLPLCEALVSWRGGPSHGEVTLGPCCTEKGTGEETDEISYKSSRKRYLLPGSDCCCNSSSSSCCCCCSAPTSSCCCRTRAPTSSVSFRCLFSLKISVVKQQRVSFWGLR